MNRYDDDRVIALLRDTVPPVPDVPDRVGAVKAKAGHQRTLLWTQTLGAMASVLLIVGVAAAVATPGGGQRVRPTARPLEALAAALARETSLRFEASLDLVDRARPIRETGLTSEQVRDVISSRVTGAATRDGDLQIEGDLSIMSAMFLGYDAFGDDDESYDGPPRFPDEMLHSFDDFRVRFVDGVQYYAAGAFGPELPAGKRWIKEERTDDPAESPAVELDRALRLVRAFAEDVHHVGSGTARGVPVAEYELTVPKSVTRTQPITVRFALDSDDRLRQVSATFSLARVMDLGHEDDETATTTPGGPQAPLGNGFGFGSPTRAPRSGSGDPMNVRVRLDVFDYGADVDVQPPPASEVASTEELHSELTGEENPPGELEKCLEKAQQDDAAIRKCYAETGVRHDLTICDDNPDDPNCASQPGSPPPAPPAPRPTSDTTSPRPAAPRPGRIPATASPTP